MWKPRLYAKQTPQAISMANSSVNATNYWLTIFLFTATHHLYIFKMLSCHLLWIHYNPHNTWCQPKYMQWWAVRSPISTSSELPSKARLKKVFISYELLPSDGWFFRQFSSDMLLWWQSTPHDSQFDCTPQDHARWRITGFQVMERTFIPSRASCWRFDKKQHWFSLLQADPMVTFYHVCILTDHTSW